MLVQSPAEQLFFSTVRITANHSGGSSFGTGFLFRYQTKEQIGTESNYPFIVTNKHVLAGADSVDFWFTEGDEADQPIIGRRIEVRIDQFKNWHGHPSDKVDIAVIPTGYVIQQLHDAGKRIFSRAIPWDLIPTEPQLAAIDAIEPITFIGYPNGMYDRTNFLPIARIGTTATPPQVDYEGFPVFLIDASVFPGSSGSPVFVLNTGGYFSRKGFSTGTRLHLLGVIAQVFTADQVGRVDIVPVPTAIDLLVSVKQMIDLGVVYKAHTIIETIEDLLKTHGLWVEPSEDQEVSGPE